MIANFIRCFTAVLVYFFLLTGTAYANVGAAGLVVFMLPAYLVVQSTGLAMVMIVFVEWFFLKNRYDGAFFKSVALVLGANIYSLVIGYMFCFLLMIPLIGFIGILVAAAVLTATFLYLLKQIPSRVSNVYKNRKILTTIISFFIFSGLGFAALYSSYALGRHWFYGAEYSFLGLVWHLSTIIIFSITTSVIFEGFVIVKGISKREGLWRTLILMNLTSYVFLGGVYWIVSEWM